MLFGREPYLRTIDEALAAARLGKSARLLIRGEPGIGKTALIEEAVARAGEMGVLRARGVEFEADLPFAGLHELLLPALGLIDQLPAVHAAALRSSLGLGERVEADRLIIGAAVLELISAHAEQRPLLVIVDDAQWLDAASADAIAFAARRLVADPVAVIVAVRSGAESQLLGAGWPELVVEGLDQPSAAQLVARSSHTVLSNESIDRLFRSTGGNPLALVELARTAPQAEGSPHLDLPVATSVERAYLQRAEGLSDDARQVLLLSAASGVSDFRVVHRAAAVLGIADHAIAEAEAVSSLVEARGDRVEFVHPLARAAIYHAASPAQRRTAHRALADATTDPSDADRRAWHLAGAATGWDSDAATALDQAARRARESSGYKAASVAFAEAAHLTEAPSVRGERLLRASESAWLAGDADTALKMLAEARRLVSSVQTLADIDYLDGQMAQRRGAVREGFRMLSAAAASIQLTDRLKAIRILADAALSAFGAGHPAEMLVAAERARDLVRPDDPPETAVFAQVAYGALAILAGRGSDGPKLLRETVPLFASIRADTGDPLMLMCTGLAGLFLREAQVGQDLLERALKQAREHAPTAALPMVLMILGRDAAATDRWSLARAQYEESARMARETTQLTWLAGSVAGLALLDALEGRAEECRAHSAEAAQLSDRYGMGFYAAGPMIALGELELGLGNLQQALAHFSECIAHLENVAIRDPDLSTAPDVVDVLVRLDRVSEAKKVSDEYSLLAAAKAQPFALARAARARALVADDRRFAEEYDLALRHHDVRFDPFERARTQLYYGERLRRARRRIEARQQLRAALKAFDQLGAVNWAERALSELNASGETARVRDDTTRQRLTPQELQVAVILAAGATTREAAAKLYLSPKTVEYHLRHVYDKLEIRTREELRQAVSRAK